MRGWVGERGGKKKEEGTARAGRGYRAFYVGGTREVLVGESGAGGGGDLGRRRRV